MRDANELVSPLNIPAWRDFPLRARLNAALSVSTYVDNDAKALARAEGWKGAAVGGRNYLALVGSTGVGGRIVVDRRLLGGRGAHGRPIGPLGVLPGVRQRPGG